MPSIQQIIAEIQLAADLPPSHKAKSIQIIRDAEARLKLRARNGYHARIRNAKGLMTLDKWETENGGLAGSGLSPWVEKNGLCVQMVLEMVAEFRVEMLAKGKQYANFKMAFQTYLTKGYLSKKMSDCKIERSPYRQQTVIDTRGVNL